MLYKRNVQLIASVNEVFGVIVLEKKRLTYMGRSLACSASFYHLKRRIIGFLCIALNILLNGFCYIAR